MTKRWRVVVLGAINVISVLVLAFPFGFALSRHPELLRSLLPTVFQQQSQKQSVGVDALLMSQQATSDANALLKQQLEEYITLRQLKVELKRFAGQQLQDGIFLTDDAMYENIAVPNDSITQSNINGMLEFVYRYYIPTYAVVVPTACAIKQDDIPSSAPLFNQKTYIDSIYRDISGVITACDVYTALFAAMDEYTYYRTHPELTGLGGYYLYTLLSDKMSGTARTLAQFEQNYLEHNFYGTLYSRIPYAQVQPDIISYYRMALFSREYSMVRYETDGTIKKYDDLIVPELLESGGDRMTDAILGGPAPMITIKVDSPYRDKLLIFTDQTVKSYLPFLAAEYGEITIVDLSLIDEKQLKSLGVNRYNQILFTYSLDTFSQVDFGQQLLTLAN